MRLALAQVCRRGLACPGCVRLGENHSGMNWKAKSAGKQPISQGELIEQAQTRGGAESRADTQTSPSFSTVETDAQRCVVACPKSHSQRHRPEPKIHLMAGARPWVPVTFGEGTCSQTALPKTGAAGAPGNLPSSDDTFLSRFHKATERCVTSRSRCSALHPV